MYIGEVDDSAIKRRQVHPISLLLGANGSGHMGPAAWIFPRQLGIWEVRAPNRTMLGADSRVGCTAGSLETSGAQIDHISNRFEPWLYIGEVSD